MRGRIVGVHFGLAISWSLQKWKEGEGSRFRGIRPDEAKKLRLTVMWSTECKSRQ
jgi:hypothetical protein